jgi:hypothetical protein
VWVGFVVALNVHLGCSYGCCGVVDGVGWVGFSGFLLICSKQIFYDVKTRSV